MAAPDLLWSSLPGKKELVVLVHGFGSSPDCFRPLLELLRADSGMTRLFDFECYQYSTSWLTLNIVRRIPRLEELSAGLAGFLESERFRGYEHITLVGHSQGGLVIQSCLAEKLKAARGEELSRIRQVILVATPNQGSNLLEPARNVLFRVFENPQERTLRVLEPHIRDMMAVMNDRVVHARTREAICWPIPVRCFWGQDDGVVPEASARGLYKEGTSLRGDHFSILKPANHQDERYLALTEAMRKPIGHAHFFDVDDYEMAVAIEPLAEGFQREFSFGPNGERKKTVHADNLAHVSRSVKFSLQNRCAELFELRYGTQNGGFIKAATSHPNEASPAELGRYDTHGMEFNFKFTPRPGETYKAAFEVYKGFDAGHRHFHAHLTKMAHYRQCRITLDLRAYLAAGYDVHPEPKMCFFPQDAGKCQDLEGMRALTEPWKSSQFDGAGTWRWELQDIEGGAVDVVWDLAERRKK
jgi:pimeloyl-ACP methyl ester carboxylesterase